MTTNPIISHIFSFLLCHSLLLNSVRTELACVAGIRKGRGRELGRETTRKGGGRRGTPARKPLFSPSCLLIKKITKITQL